jgi:hypothetical protein
MRAAARAVRIMRSPGAVAGRRIICADDSQGYKLGVLLDCKSVRLFLTGEPDFICQRRGAARSKCGKTASEINEFALSGGQGVVGSNPATPTIKPLKSLNNH